MNKKELIAVLAKKQPQLNRKDVELAVNCILTQMEQTLLDKDRIEIRDFGSFTARKLQARTRRNPKTGEILSKPSHYVFRFKPGKELKQTVNKAKDKYLINNQ
ncbi:MAG: integration host factor subunit beta [Methyloglobulus sp.]|nr:integration host factor subunit beta [Methyloglobulus sp.]